jgi:hypothetical protein
MAYFRKPRLGTRLAIASVRPKSSQVHVSSDRRELAAALQWSPSSIYKFSSECGDKPPLRAQP